MTDRAVKFSHSCPTQQLEGSPFRITVSHRFGPKRVKSLLAVGRRPPMPFRPATARNKSLQNEGLSEHRQHCSPAETATTTVDEIAVLGRVSRHALSVRPSTTVAIPRYDSGAVGNDTIALPIDADGAICSIPTPAPRRATPSALNAKTNAVSPPHSTRHQAPRRFEAQQTAHRRAFFFHHLQVGGPHGTQQRQRPHRQGDVTIPPRPTANLILI